jgi:hypothetical protein
LGIDHVQAFGHAVDRRVQQPLSGSQLILAQFGGGDV